MLKSILGRREITPDFPTHVPGIKQGNSKGNYEAMSGHHRDGTSSAARSTGVSAELEEPIDPSMPNLSPA
jgi:hypothetical protein